MKKISIILLSFLLCVSFCSCSGAKVKDANTTTENTSVRDASSTKATENTTTTSVDVSDSKKSATKKTDIIQNNTTTTIKKKNNKPNDNSNQNSKVQDNVHVNAEDLVGGNYFD